MPGPTPSFFDGLPPEELEGILGSLERRRFPAGAVVIAEGETLRNVFIAESGRAEVFVSDRRGEEHRVGEVVPGATLGEMSLFTGQPAVGTVRAVEDLDVLVMTDVEFERTCTRFPLVYRNLGSILSKRLALTNRLILREQPGRLIVLEDAGAPPLLGWALACSVAWHTQASTCLVYANGPPGPDLQALAATSRDGGRHEGARLLLGEPDSVERLCAEYEHVLIQAPAGSSPDADGARRIRLDAAPAGEAPPSGLVVSAWHERTNGVGRPDLTGMVAIPPLDTHDEDGVRNGGLTLAGAAGRNLGWVARDLAGLKVGLALGAGSIRGFAHWGVLRAFERAQIPIDYLVGTSVGAAAGGLYALGYKDEEGIEKLTDAGRALFRPTIPVRGMLSSRAIRNFMKRAGERGDRDVRLEELELPFAAVAVDLKTRREVVFRRGPLYLAVLASMSIPGVYPAVRMGPYLCVDGGILDPVPVGPAAEMGAGVAIGVRLVSRHPGEPDFDAEAGPGTGRLPTAASSIIRSIDIMQTAFMPPTTEATTVIITPELEDIRSARLRNFGEGRRYVDSGEAGVEAAMPRIAGALPWLGAQRRA